MPGRRKAPAKGTALAKTDGAVREYARYPDRALKITDLVVKCAFLDVFGYSAAEIAVEAGCSKQHVSNLRTHPEYRQLRTDIVEGGAYDVSAELKVYMARSLRAASQAIDTAVDMLDAEDNDGLAQHGIRAIGVKELLGNLGRLATAGSRQAGDAVSAGGTVLVSINLGDTKSLTEVEHAELLTDIEDGEFSG